MVSVFALDHYNRNTKLFFFQLISIFSVSMLVHYHTFTACLWKFVNSRVLKECLRCLFRITLEQKLLSSCSLMSICACSFLKTWWCLSSWNYNANFCPKGHVRRTWNQFHMNWWILLRVLANKFYLILNISPKIRFTYWEVLLEPKIYPLRPQIYIKLKAALPATCNNSILHFHQEVS